jgi:hypothetical protein
VSDGKATDEQLERAARNQSIFRAVNERLEGIAESFEDVADTAIFTCECADLGCIQMIEMTLAEYEDLRKESNRFAVLPGHVLPDVERVVSANDRFVVVAKLGDGERVAEELDPRE